MSRDIEYLKKLREATDLLNKAYSLLDDTLEYFGLKDDIDKYFIDLDRMQKQEEKKNDDVQYNA